MWSREELKIRRGQARLTWTTRLDSHFRPDHPNLALALPPHPDALISTHHPDPALIEPQSSIRRHRASRRGMPASMHGAREHTEGILLWCVGCRRCRRGLRMYENYTASQQEKKRWALRYRVSGRRRRSPCRSPLARPRRRKVCAVWIQMLDSQDIRRQWETGEGEDGGRTVDRAQDARWIDSQRTALYLDCRVRSRGVGVEDHHPFAGWTGRYQLAGSEYRWSR